jgi:DNA-directed RNA polymerase subunit E'
MFYKYKIQDYIRVPPHLFTLDIEEAIIKQIKSEYEGFISNELGIIIDVSEIENIGEGTIVPGDGAPFYDTTFTLLSFKPEMQEVINGKIKDITDFGAFITMGPTEGMIHVSQTMDDFVSFSKEKVLVGKDSKKSLRVNDKCRARIIAVSFKDLNNPKIGLTMRQKGLGRLDWITEEINAPEKPVKEKAEKEKPAGKPAGKKK